MCLLFSNDDQSCQATLNVLASMSFTSHEYTQNLLNRVLQMGQILGMFATASAQLEQKREYPQGTRATPERGAIRQTTSHIALSVVAVAAAAVTVARSGSG